MWRYIYVGIFNASYIYIYIYVILKLSWLLYYEYNLLICKCRPSSTLYLSQSFRFVFCNLCIHLPIPCSIKSDTTTRWSHHCGHVLFCLATAFIIARMWKGQMGTHHCQSAIFSWHRTGRNRLELKAHCVVDMHEQSGTVPLGFQSRCSHFQVRSIPWNPDIN